MHYGETSPMTTIAAAIARLGWDVDNPLDIPIVRIPKGGTPIHSTHRTSGDRQLADITDDLYVVAALYRPAKISTWGGRKAENVERVLEFPFDCDLKDFLDLPIASIHALPQEELDSHIAALKDEAQRLFSLAEIPVHRVRYSGYGIYIDVRIAEEDQHRIAEIAGLHKQLIERINVFAGSTFVDPQASDAPTRLTRLVGSRNFKDPKIPRPVTILFESKGAIRLSQLPTALPRPISVQTLPEDISEMRLAEDDLEEIVKAISDHYAEGQRNAIDHLVPTMLLKAGVPRDQVELVFEQVTADDEDPGKGMDAVCRTCDRWEEGEPISGFTGLERVLGEKHPVVVEVSGILLKRKAAVSAPTSTFPYEATSGGLVYKERTKDGEVKRSLCNFNAHIVEERLVDDGAAVESQLVIAGELAGGKPLPQITVPNKQFAGLSWVLDQWGSRAIITAGFAAKDRTREAIQRLSSDIVHHRVYGHPGWRQIEGEWLYLHAKGAIGPSGPVSGTEVVLHGAAKHIVIPDPPRDSALHDAVQASLDLLELGPDDVMALLLGAVYRSPLMEMLAADVTPFLIGPSGAFKSEIAALAMQHFGATFSRTNLPAQWVSTGNALERIGFDFKDALCVIDDFAPAGTQTDVQRLHKTAENVIRGIGNHGGRSRMNANGTLRANYPPRGMVLGTGEDAPIGHSLRARMILAELSRGDIRVDLLTEAQAAGREGVFVAGMAGYLQWLGAHFEQVRAALLDQFAELRALATGGQPHARTPEAVAHIALGWQTFLRFAEDVGAITEKESEAVFARVWGALTNAAESQRLHQESQEPASQFVEALASALAGGFAHVASKDGTDLGQQSPAWGWREKFPAAWEPQGARVGWLDGDDLYLNVDVAIAAVRNIGPVVVTKTTLNKRLHEGGYLKSVGGKGEICVRRTVEERRTRVLHLSAAVFGVEKSGQPGQDGQDAEEIAQGRENAMSGYDIVWSNDPASRLKSVQLAGKDAP